MDCLPPLHLVDRDLSRQGRVVWELTQPFEYRVGLNGGGLVVAVPPGFLTDFASVPRLFWRLYPPAGPYRKPAVVHDYLYSTAANCPRFLADAIFRDAMSRVGIPLRTQLLMYYAVRCFGGSAYHAR